MRTLWRTTASLLRKYPILWLPVALAKLFAFNLGWIVREFRRWLIPQLLNWLSESHSVLSNSPIYGEPSQRAMNKAIFLVAPLEWVARFASDFILACALVATAAILYRITKTGPATLRDAVPTIADSSRRILIFSLILFGLNIVAGSLGSLVALLNIPVLQYKFETSLDLSLKSSIALENSNIFPILIDHIWVLPITLCLVYVVAPLQLRLVQPPDFGFSLGQKRDARLAAILAAVASSVLGIVTAILESQLFQHLRLAATFTYPIWTITALINAVPFVFLYVALYLIANPDSPVAVPPSSRAGGDFPT